eukprot:GHVH01017457.1.p1 GENE.GHVH01017457.1~~GHVH01017457.1.p1  ORF type:complete len:324 (+),score=38.58 GHVH01017457.1:95-1066(+)
MTHTASIPFKILSFTGLSSSMRRTFLPPVGSTGMWREDQPRSDHRVVAALMNDMHQLIDVPDKGAIGSRLHLTRKGGHIPLISVESAINKHPSSAFMPLGRTPEDIIDISIEFSTDITKIIPNRHHKSDPIFQIITGEDTSKSGAGTLDVIKIRTHMLSQLANKGVIKEAFPLLFEKGKGCAILTCKRKTADQIKVPPLKSCREEQVKSVLAYFNEQSITKYRYLMLAKLDDTIRTDGDIEALIELAEHLHTVRSIMDNRTSYFLGHESSANCRSHFIALIDHFRTQLEDYEPRHQTRKRVRRRKRPGRSKSSRARDDFDDLE